MQQNEKEQEYQHHYPTVFQTQTSTMKGKLECWRPSLSLTYSLGNTNAM